jgi:hypothetical protein
MGTPYSFTITTNVLPSFFELEINHQLKYYYENLLSINCA